LSIAPWRRRPPHSTLSPYTTLFRSVNSQCDSYHMLTHPGVLIVPAGLATAAGEGRTGRELLAALAAGYEVQCRCARDFIPSTPADRKSTRLNSSHAKISYAVFCLKK